MRANEPSKSTPRPTCPTGVPTPAARRRPRRHAGRSNKLPPPSTKIGGPGAQIERQEDMVDRREDAVGHRKAEQTWADFELITSLFTRRKRSLSSSLSKRRLTKEAQTSCAKPKNRSRPARRVEQPARRAQRSRPAHPRRLGSARRRGHRNPPPPTAKDIFPECSASPGCPTTA